MKRHVVNGCRRRLALEKRDRDVVVADRDTILEIELFLESQRALEPLRTLLRIAHGQAKVTDGAESEWNAHDACKENRGPRLVRTGRRAEHVWFRLTLPVSSNKRPSRATRGVIPSSQPGRSPLRGMPRFRP